MYIFVRDSDKVIIGCSVRPVNEEDMKRQGNIVYEVSDADFSYSMIGQKLEDFDTLSE